MMLKGTTVVVLLALFCVSAQAVNIQEYLKPVRDMQRLRNAPNPRRVVSYTSVFSESLASPAATSSFLEVQGATECRTGFVCPLTMKNPVCCKGGDMCCEGVCINENPVRCGLTPDQVRRNAEHLKQMQEEFHKTAGSEDRTKTDEENIKNEKGRIAQRNIDEQEAKKKAAAAESDQKRKAAQDQRTQQTISQMNEENKKKEDMRKIQEQAAKNPATPLNLNSATLPTDKTVRKPSYRNVDGVCIISGRVNVPANGALLDVGYTGTDCYPMGIIQFDLSSTQGVKTARMDINSRGRVTRPSGSPGNEYYDLDGMVYPSGRSNSKMSSLNFEGEWQAYTTAGEAPVQIYRSGDLCVLQGVVGPRRDSSMYRSKKWGGKIATLPEECRPADGRLMFNVNHDAYSHRIDILPDGSLMWQQGTVKHPWVSLGGLSWMVYKSGVKDDKTTIDLGAGFSNYGGGYRLPTWKLQGNTVNLGGLVQVNDPAATIITTLPAQLRPAWSITFTTAYRHRIQIDPTGKVTWLESAEKKSTKPFIALDSITYTVS